MRMGLAADYMSFRDYDIYFCSAQRSVYPVRLTCVYD